MIIMQVEAAQTGSSPNKIGRPWGSFTPEKFFVINQTGASGGA